MFWWIFILISGLKLLLMASYRSTDFEVHRNWLAITYTLPIDKWYLEDTSEWTLDYPPFFAYFEWLLSRVACYFDSQMLKLDNLNYASPKTILFQRLSVIFTDIVFAIGVRKCMTALKIDNNIQKLAATIILLGNVGLIFVDHIHFQYNGLLFGILLLSIGYMIEECYLTSAIIFAALLNFKHIFLYITPAFGAFLLKFYCFEEKRNVFVNFLSAFLSGGSVFVFSFGPFYKQLPEVLSRLFPFKRGLTHSYWAPNFWALYNSVDKLAEIILRIPRQSKSNTAGLVQEYKHAFLPVISPITTFVLTICFMVPCIVKLLFFTEKKHSKVEFLKAVVICSLSSFTFGWHVHEKAILMSLIPLSFLSVSNVEDAKCTIILSVAGTFSHLPLLFNKELFLIKYSLFLTYNLTLFCLLKFIHKKKLFLRWYELFYVLGFFCLSIYEQVFHPFLKLDKNLPFLPLLLTSLYCCFGIMFIFLKYYIKFLCSNRKWKFNDIYNNEIFKPKLKMK